MNEEEENKSDESYAYDELRICLREVIIRMYDAFFDGISDAIKETSAAGHDLHIYPFNTLASLLDEIRDDLSGPYSRLEEEILYDLDRGIKAVYREIEQALDDAPIRERDRVKGCAGSPSQ